MTVAETRVAGRYRLGPSLGVGGMGRVWLAHDEILQRQVAIKEVALPFGLPEDEREELRRRTLREARAAARLTHPNVVRIYDVVNGEKQPWIVMEYVRARSLLQVVEEQGPLPVEQVARIGLAVLSALEAANRAGVLHGDVKPSNVLMADDGRVVLTDFGSAILDDTESAITKTGMILGSPQYIAPERARQGSCTPQSDLWSLGATLFTAVEGRSPFNRPTALATLVAVATERPDPVRRGAALRPVISGLLKKDPKARISASEAERRLRQVAGPGPEPVRPVPAQRPPSDPVEPAEPAGRGELPAAPPPVPPPTAPAGGPGAVTVALPVPAPPAASVTAPAAGRRLQWMIAAAAAIVVLALGVFAFAAPAGDPTSTAPTATNGQATSRPADAAAPRSTPPQAQPLPANLTWWYDQSGFVVPVPTGWNTLREGPDAMLFREPGGPPTLRVHPWDERDLDPVVAMTHEEAGANLADYHRLRIQALPDGRGAEWEYTFTDPTMGYLHGMERGIIVKGHAYVIQWRVPVPAWQARLADYTAVVDGFQPPRPASKNQI